MAKEKETAVATTASTAMEARPDFIPAGDRSGREHITKEDIKLPRLQVAQALSPEIQEIEGLQMGMFFNDLTRENMGKNPVSFWIVRADPPRWVEFRPREQGGGVVDPNVPYGDPRTRPDAQGNTIATQFYNFVVFMTRDGVTEPIALSLKGKAGTRAARTLNGLVTMRNAATYAGNYTVSPGVVKGAKGTFGVYLFKNDGWAKTQAEFEARRQAAEDYKDRVDDIPIDDQGHEEGDTDFNPSKLEQEGQATSGTSGM